MIIIVQLLVVNIKVQFFMVYVQQHELWHFKWENWLTSKRDQPPNKGQNARSQVVLYSEVPLYIYLFFVFIFFMLIVLFFIFKYFFSIFIFYDVIYSFCS